MFSTLSDAEGTDFQALLRLYEEALPARERKSAEAVRAMIASPNYRVLLAQAGEEIVGFAILLIGKTMALLEYMAVRQEVRGQGVGSSLYRYARDACAPRGLPLLVEVDSEREIAPDRDDRLRRKQFYLRLGCRQIDGLDYQLPLPGEKPPPLMDMLVDSPLSAQIPREKVAAWLREIYRSAYDCEMDDPRLLAMLGSLPTEVTLA
jgi:GNAT superfamily N-acetyltransferase